MLDEDSFLDQITHDSPSMYEMMKFVLNCAFRCRGLWIGDLSRQWQGNMLALRSQGLLSPIPDMPPR